MTGDLPPNAATRQWMEATDSKLLTASRLANYAHEHTIRVGICARVEEVAVLKQDLLERFGDRVVMHNLMVPAYGVEVLEVFDPAVNKWQGILHIAAKHGVDPKQIVAIGDDVNDIPMIRNAGLGVAMGNARPEVQAIAKRVIGTNAEEGLAAFLDELVAAHLVEPADESTDRRSRC
jgi:hypothetical protein